MTIEEARGLKEQLEKSITGALQNFEDQTGLAIASVTTAYIKPTWRSPKSTRTKIVSTTINIEL